MKSSAGKIEPVLINMSTITPRDHQMYKNVTETNVPFTMAFPTST